MNDGMTVPSEMAGIQGFNMTELSCIAGLDNQSIACTRITSGKTQATRPLLQAAAYTPAAIAMTGVQPAGASAPMRRAIR